MKDAMDAARADVLRDMQAEVLEYCISKGWAGPVTVVDGEVGRLDRLLVGHRAGIAVQDVAATPYQRQALAEALAYAEARTPPEVVRLRAMVVALEAECAALTDALGDPNVTHPFDPMHAEAGVICGAEKDEDSYCALPAAAAVHRTPARVRAELEER